jgi:hypothetical protein
MARGKALAQANFHGLTPILSWQLNANGFAAVAKIRPTDKSR